MGNEEQLRASLLEAASDGRIACRRALELAALFGVSGRRVRELLDQLGIKVVECQLGCF